MRINKLKQEILFILSEYPESRNSDIRLTNLIWWKFYNSKVFQNETGDYCIRLKDLYSVPREDNVKRIRAKIQNEEQRFLPTEWKVAKQRKINEESWRRAMGYEPPFVE